jgi:2-amino-4-hydroxy-6-hydroxymethyldihydropteridine diphosphokinase
MKNVFLSIGSNIGNRIMNIEKAISYLDEFLNDITVSSFYETKPMYVLDQPNFINVVVRGHTEHDYISLLKMIKEIEADLGREMDSKMVKGPRIIDIDILLINDTIVQTEELTIPHKYMYERQFVLIPLLELEPDLIDPVSRRPFSEFKNALPDQGVTKIS